MRPASRLSETADTWRRAVAPVAEFVARALWSTQNNADRGKECDARTDIYALGLVLREMATGHREGTTLGLTPQLAHVIERCLATEPESSPFT